MSSPTVPITQGVTYADEKEKCECEHHVVIHPVSGGYPPCMYAEVQEIVVNSKGDSNFTVKKRSEPDKVTLMEDNGWFVEKNDQDLSGMSTLHQSWIGHYCPTLLWKIYLNETIVMAEGVCSHCMKKVPPGLIALWKMHNWEYLQNSPHHGDEWEEACVTRDPNAPPVWEIPELGDDADIVYKWRGLI